jgi:ribosomal protein L37AE/L43A
MGIMTDGLKCESCGTLMVDDGDEHECEECGADASEMEGVFVFICEKCGGIYETQGEADDCGCE